LSYVNCRNFFKNRPKESLLRGESIVKVQDYHSFLSHRSVVLLAAPRLRNDLHCVEWDVKLYYTIQYLAAPISSKFRTTMGTYAPLRGDKLKPENIVPSNCSIPTGWWFANSCR